MSWAKRGTLLGNLRRQLDDDDENSYLSKETINRREDQKLLDRITSTLYRLELENVKPSFDVKLKTGLHRGPYKSRRGRRSHTDVNAQSSYGSSRAASCPSVSTLVNEHGRERPVHLQHRVARRPDFDKNDRDGPTTMSSYTAAVAAAAATDNDQWLPPVEHYHRRRYENPLEGYDTQSGKWLREIGQIDAETRRRKALAGYALEPTTARRLRATDDYNELLSVLAREGVGAGCDWTTEEASSRASRGFFDNDPAPVDDGDKFLERLMDRPFVRGGLTNGELKNWRAIRANDSNNYYSVDY